MSPRAIILTLLLAFTAIVFAPVLGNDFVIQDDYLWLAHPRLRPPTMENLAWFWSPANATEGLWVPLSYTVWSGLSLISYHPALFHAASLALHLLSVLMVWIILRRLVGSDIPSAIGALLFAIHPLQVESVAWASGLKDLLAALLSLAAIHHYIRSVDAGPSRARATHYGLCVIALIAGMLAKPSAVVMPVIALVIDRWMLGSPWRPILLRTAPLLVLTIPCIVWSRIAQTVYPEMITPLMIRPFVAADAIAFYMYKLVWPITLSNLYGRTPGAVESDGSLWVTWLAPAALAVVLYLLRRRMPMVAGGAVVAVVAIGPVLGFSPFLYQLYSTVADHYMYLPMFGVAMAVAAIAARVAGRVLIPVAIALLLLLGLRSTLQTRYWRNSIVLFSHAVDVQPLNVPAHAGLGRALAARGRLRDAIPEFQFVLDHQPGNSQALALMGQAMLELGDYERAVAHLSEAARRQPEDQVIQTLLNEAQRRIASPATTQ